MRPPGSGNRKFQVQRSLAESCGRAQTPSLSSASRGDSPGEGHGTPEPPRKRVRGGCPQLKLGAGRGRLGRLPVPRRGDGDPVLIIYRIILFTYLIIIRIILYYIISLYNQGVRSPRHGMARCAMAWAWPSITKPSQA